MRNELEHVMQSLRDVPPDELPSLIGQLEAIKAAAWARLSSPAPALQQDRLLDVESAAERLGVSVGYLYQNHRSLPFSRKMGKRLLFSQNGIDRYIKTAM